MAQRDPHQPIRLLRRGQAWSPLGDRAAYRSPGEGRVNQDQEMLAALLFLVVMVATAALFTPAHAR